jgi:hypothetical protein
MENKIPDGEKLLALLALGFTGAIILTCIGWIFLLIFNPWG